MKQEQKTHKSDYEVILEINKKMVGILKHSVHEIKVWDKNMITAEEQINDLKDVWKTLPEGSRKAKVDWNRKKGKMSFWI